MQHEASETDRQGTVEQDDGDEDEDIDDDEEDQQAPFEEDDAQAADEDHEAALELSRCAQMRIECAKVCAPLQLIELAEGSQNTLAKVKRIKSADGLRRLLPGAKQELVLLENQWQQRSGTIRVVVRVRPAGAAIQDANADEPEEGPQIAVKTVNGNTRCRGVTVTHFPHGRKAETASFSRFDYILGPLKNQASTYAELKGMLPSAGPHGLTGPPQSTCILAYGQTGSGKTYTMHGGDGEEQGLVPRVLVEVFRLAENSGAEVWLSAIEVYNDAAYDLCDVSGPVEKEAAGRAFEGGRIPPPSGLDFRHGCANALSQAKSVAVKSVDDACAALALAAERRSTRHTVFNDSSSRSHSLVFVHVQLPGSVEPQWRIAFVDLAGSERLPGSQAGQVIEESKHINLSLSSLGSVIHALRNRSNHLPFRACLLTRLLEPYFGASGRVLLVVNVAPEQRHAAETLCSLAFADRASRAVLGVDSASEVQRSQVLAQVREAHTELRSHLRELMPSVSLSRGPRQRLPDWLAGEILQYMEEHGDAAYVCRAWATMCKSHKWWGRALRQDHSLAKDVLQFLSPAMTAAGVCRSWWRAAGAFRMVLDAASADVMQASNNTTARSIWTDASALIRRDVWNAVLAAGGGSGTRGAWPLGNVRECAVAGMQNAEALKNVLMRCPELRVAEVLDPDLLEASCGGLIHCPELRIFRCALALLPMSTAFRHLFTKCPLLKVLVLMGSADLHTTLHILAVVLPRKCGLQEISATKCTVDWHAMEVISKACKRLRTLRLPYCFVESDQEGRGPPPLKPLSRLKRLRTLDFRAMLGRAYNQRPWLTDNMLGVAQELSDLREVIVTDQKLLTEQCFRFMRKHCLRLQVLNMHGCQPMDGEKVFAFLHRCETIVSLRLPQLVQGHSERNLGVSTNRWCELLTCPRLRELCVDGWASLEDSGVRMLVENCRRLTTVGLQRAPQLSNDAVTYLVSLPELTNLSLAYAAGITNEALEDLASATRLRYLDLSACRQLTDEGVAHFADKLGKVDGPLLRTIRLDLCPRLSIESARALAASLGLRRCSLAGCQPMPEAAVTWNSPESHADACEVLEVDVPVMDAMGDEGNDLEQHANQASDDSDELGSCAICMDDLQETDAMWQCAVCRKRLHDTEECARGWLRLKQSCPTCRSVAIAPETPVAAGPGKRNRKADHRAASVDALRGAARSSGTGNGSLRDPIPLATGPNISVSGSAVPYNTHQNGVQHSVGSTSRSAPPYSTHQNGVQHSVGSTSRSAPPRPGVDGRPPRPGAAASSQNLAPSARGGHEQQQQRPRPTSYAAASRGTMDRNVAPRSSQASQASQSSLMLMGPQASSAPAQGRSQGGVRSQAPSRARSMPAVRRQDTSSLALIGASIVSQAQLAAALS